MARCAEGDTASKLRPSASPTNVTGLLPLSSFAPDPSRSGRGPAASPWPRVRKFADRVEGSGFAPHCARADRRRQSIRTPGGHEDMAKLSFKFATSRRCAAARDRARPSALRFCGFTSVRLRGWRDAVAARVDAAPAEEETRQLRTRGTCHISGGRRRGGVTADTKGLLCPKRRVGPTTLALL